MISDLHLCGQIKTNRYDYDAEIIVVAKQLLFLISHYIERDYSVNLIFLGDIFDKSYRKPEKAGVDISLLDLILSRANTSYAVIGNHEINYYVNNPFWTMISSISSERLSNSENFTLQPLGYLNKFKVLDSLEVGDCVFHFNHFSCVDSIPVFGKKNIAFYHKSIYSKEVADNCKSNGITTNFSYIKSVSSVSALERYDMCFMGHLHTLSGVWRSKNTLIYYLSSLGRPHKDEVTDLFLERCIPSIIFKNDAYSGVELHKFNLPSRDESIIPEISEEEISKYKIAKAVKEVKDYLGSSDDPIQNIRALFVSDSESLRLIDSFLEGNHSKYLNEFSDRLVSIRKRREEFQ